MGCDAFSLQMKPLKDAACKFGNSVKPKIILCFCTRSLSKYTPFDSVHECRQ